MINILIDNDKSPKVRINLNFPASSGCLIFHPPNTGSGPAKSGPAAKSPFRSVPTPLLVAGSY